MRRILFSVLVLSAFSGCAVYDVRVNGYVKGEPQFTGGKTIYVHIDKDAENPILEQEVAGKIKKALEMKGYIPAESLKEARYMLVYDYGVDSGVKFTYPIDDYDLRILTGRYGITRTITKVLFTRHLLLKLYAGNDPALLKENEPLWVGDVTSRGEGSDLRSIIDYLIVGGLEHFGEDTGKQEWHSIRSTDERIKRLKASGD